MGGIDKLEGGQGKSVCYRPCFPLSCLQRPNYFYSSQKKGRISDLTIPTGMPTVGSKKVEMGGGENGVSCVYMYLCMYFSFLLSFSLSAVCLICHPTTFPLSSSPCFRFEKLAHSAQIILCVMTTTPHPYI